MMGNGATLMKAVQRRIRNNTTFSSLNFSFKVNNTLLHPEITEWCVVIGILQKFIFLILIVDSEL